MSSSKSKHTLGFRFHPTDKELINYLRKFMLREILPPMDFIKVKEVFGALEPWQIIDGEKTCYFLSPLTRFKNSTKKFSRTVGTGTWKGQTRSNPISDGSRTIGYKRSLRYVSDVEVEQSEKWLMKEYFLPEECVKKSWSKDVFVICRIKQKKQKDEEDDHYREVAEEQADELIHHLLGSNDQLDVNYEVVTNHEANTSTLNNNVQHEDYGGLNAEANSNYLEGGEVEQFSGINPYDNYSFDNFLLDNIDFSCL